MDLQAAYRARLLANGTIAGLVTKIAWGGVPQQTTLPYIRLIKISPGREWTHEGPNPLVQPMVQVEVFAANHPQLGPIVAAIQAEMERLDDVTAGGWKFLPPGMIENDQWLEPEEISGGAQVYRVLQDYRFYAQPEG